MVPIRPHQVVHLDNGEVRFGLPVEGIFFAVNNVPVVEIPASSGFP